LKVERGKQKVEKIEKENTNTLKIMVGFATADQRVVASGCNGVAGK